MTGHISNYPIEMCAGVKIKSNGPQLPTPGVKSKSNGPQLPTVDIEWPLADLWQFRVACK